MLISKAFLTFLASFILCMNVDALEPPQCPPAIEVNDSAPEVMYELERIEDGKKNDFVVTVSKEYKSNKLSGISIHRSLHEEVVLGAELAMYPKGEKFWSAVFSVPSSDVAEYNFLIVYSSNDGRCGREIRRYKVSLT